MWRELRADRFEAEVLADIRRAAGRSHGSDLQVPGHAAALTTALRYQGSAGMAARRAVAPSSSTGRRGRRGCCCRRARANPAARNTRTN